MEHQNDMNDPEVDRERKLLPTTAAHAIYINDTAHAQEWNESITVLDVVCSLLWTFSQDRTFHCREVTMKSVIKHPVGTLDDVNI